MLTYREVPEMKREHKTGLFCLGQGAHGSIETRASKLLREGARSPGSPHVMS